jgi:hypothetical protein
MAGSKSDYLENELLDHILGNSAGAWDWPSSPLATVYIALYTAAPTDAGGGTEVTGGSYARATVANTAANWPAAASGAKANGTQINFATSTASWGTIVAFGIFDALSGGNLLYWGELPGSGVVIGSGQTAYFAVGDIDVTED